MNLEVSANRVLLLPIPRCSNPAHQGDTSQMQTPISSSKGNFLFKFFPTCFRILLPFFKSHLEYGIFWGLRSDSFVYPPQLGCGRVAPKAVARSRGGATDRAFNDPVGGRGERQQQESPGGGRTGGGERTRRDFSPAHPHHMTTSGCRSESRSSRGPPCWPLSDCWGGFPAAALLVLIAVSLPSRAPGGPTGLAATAPGRNAADRRRRHPRRHRP